MPRHLSSVRNLLTNYQSSITNHRTMFDQSIATSKSTSTFAVRPASKIAKRSPSGKELFICPEESNFYSQSLDAMVLSDCVTDEAVIEFGSGDGLPVINSLLRTEFNGL